MASAADMETRQVRLQEPSGNSDSLEKSRLKPGLRIPFTGFLVKPHTTCSLLCIIVKDFVANFFQEMWDGPIMVKP